MYNIINFKFIIFIHNHYILGGCGFHYIGILEDNNDNWIVLHDFENYIW